MANKEIIITAAVVGSRPMKKDNPAVPYSPKEIVAQAVDCWSAGAAIAHIHVRDPQTGTPAFHWELFAQVLDGIREKTDMVVNLSTSGFNLPDQFDIQNRLMPIYLRPDTCSLDVGSVNFFDRPFINPPEWGVVAATIMQEQGVKPEIEVFDTGHISQALDLVKRGLIDPPSYFQLCMGVKWGIEATGENLQFMKSKLPPEALWSVLGIGPYQWPMITLAMEMGGHVRVGFEDNIYISKGVLAKSNAQFVEKAVTEASNRGRIPVTSSRAREILGIK